MLTTQLRNLPAGLAALLAFAVVASEVLIVTSSEASREPVFEDDAARCAPHRGRSLFSSRETRCRSSIRAFALARSVVPNPSVKRL